MKRIKCKCCGKEVASQFTIVDLCFACAQTELARLRGIEKALQWMTYEFAKIRDNPPSVEAAIFWRLKSELCKGPEGIMYGLIADALDVKS